ncbi:hypothetical protein COLO4_12711 [Corchorus olitorius]|uniref:Uncharacterized protein n=1 Tax=Corchorus olitorius TaxID=93759 RepID=A0A1R3JZZ6_9ROSI|nr:hypothetical protein COLO4_12711 [Corchorus olitorius]
MEFKADKIGLQRSEQLRELYKSLLAAETDQTKRLSAALSPEDLSDAEWYYLVCMSFVFDPGQGLPGRALANGETIWLCNAQNADSKIFSRSLLAKTVVCFPYLGGVIELGVTELVPEDLNLIQHIKASLLDFSKPVCSEKSSSALLHDPDGDTDPLRVKVEHEIVDLLDLENLFSPTEEIKFDQEKFNELLHDNINEGFNNIDSPVHECSNGCEQNPQTEDSFMLEGVNGVVASQVQSWHFMDDQNSISSSDRISEAFAKEKEAAHLDLGLGNDEDLHYRRTLSAILGTTSNWLTETHGVHTCGSIVPSISEIDKDSILSETIKYLKKLEARVEELESCMDFVDFETKPRRNCLDMVEQTSGNYENKKSWINKRKACDIDESHEELNRVGLISDVKVKVTMEEKEEEVVIEIRCPCRDYLLLDIMDAVNNLQMDTHTVRSSTLQGLIVITLKSKFRGPAIPPAGMIKQALEKVATK